MGIVKTEEVLGGEPRIEGRRISVLQVYELVYGAGKDPDEVAEMYDLPVADVYAALQYYFEHLDEMEEVREKRAETERKARKKALTPEKPPAG